MKRLTKHFLLTFKKWLEVSRPLGALTSAETKETYIQIEFISSHIYFFQSNLTNDGLTETHSISSKGSTVYNKSDACISMLLQKLWAYIRWIEVCWSQDRKENNHTMRISELMMLFYMNHFHWKSNILCFWKLVIYFCN